MKRIILLGSVLLLWVCQSALAVEVDATPDLVSVFKSIQTYSAHFNQKIHDANGQHVSKTQGDIIVQRPGKFYWKTAAPDKMLIVADGKFLWTYDIELDQVTQQKLKEALGNSPAALLAGSVPQLADHFFITYGKKNQCAQGCDKCFVLKPKQKEATFADIIIGLSSGKLVEVRMHDPLGQDVYTTFSNVKTNQKVNVKLFAFVPPKGVDIIQSGN